MSVTTTHRPSDGSAPRSDRSVAIVAPSYRGSRRSRPTTFAGIALRTPYWVVTAALALLFLYPLIWTAISSVSPRAGRASPPHRP